VAGEVSFMQGRVFQRNPGRGKPWSYVIDLPRSADGKRKQLKKGRFRTRNDAEEGLAAAIEDVRNGRTPRQSKEHVATYLLRWADEQSAHWAPGTVETNAVAIKSWIIPLLGDVRLDQLTAPMLQDFFTQLSKSGSAKSTPLGPRSVKLCHDLLRSALDQAEEFGVITRSPARHRFSLPKARPGAPEHWLEDDAARFLSATSHERLWPLWMLFLSTGLRRGEALGLDWEHVNFSKMELAIVNTWRASRSGGAAKGQPKTPQSRRVISIPMKMGPVFQELRERQQKEYASLGIEWTAAVPVFTTTIATRYDPRNTSREFTRCVVQSGIKKLSIHGLRHTFATIALCQGVHPKVVQEMLGHSTVRMTLDLYSHAVPGMHRDASERIGDLLFADGLEWRPFSDAVEHRSAT
jgi:integrase